MKNREKKILWYLVAMFIGLSIGMWLWFMYEINEVKKGAAHDAQEIARLAWACERTIPSGIDSPQCRELDRISARHK